MPSWIENLKTLLPLLTLVAVGAGFYTQKLWGSDFVRKVCPEYFLILRRMNHQRKMEKQLVLTSSS
jgi:hypothetical protein